MIVQKYFQKFGMCWKRKILRKDFFVWCETLLTHIVRVFTLSLLQSGLINDERKEVIRLIVRSAELVYER